MRCYLWLKMMGSVYVDPALKGVIQSRVNALSDPNDGVIVSERDALVDMLDSQYQIEYQRRRDE